jgi:hypothetical protein
MGTLDDGEVTFAAPQYIPTPAGGGFSVGVRSDPVIARAGNNLYLAVVREQISGPSGESLHGWRVILYRYNNDGTWSSLGPIPGLWANFETYLGLGGSSTGKLLAASIRKERSRNEVELVKYENNTWTSFSDEEIATVYNKSPGWHPFVILGSK